jgi:hypothetical protein
MRYQEWFKGSALVSLRLCLSAAQRRFLQVLRMAHLPVLLASSVPSVDGGLTRWDDTSAPLDVDDDPSHLEQVDQTGAGADTLKTDNVQQVDKASHSSILQPTPNGPSPMSGSPSPSIHDSASMHSLNVVQVTASQRSSTLPQAPDISSLSDNDRTTQVQRAIGLSASAPPPSQRRSSRSRPAMEVRRLCCMLF